MTSNDLPQPVAEAVVILRRRNRTVFRLLTGTVACILGIATAALTAAMHGLGELPIQVLTLTMLAWVGVHVFLLARHSGGYDRAREVYRVWQRRHIDQELGAEAQATPTAGPADPRWEALATTIARVRSGLGEEDPLLEQTETLLRELLGDAAALREAAEVERSLGADDTTSDRLTLLARRQQAVESQIAQLTSVLRDLHVELVVRGSDEVQALVDRLRATREVLETERSSSPQRLPREADIEGGGQTLRTPEATLTTD